MNDDVQYMQYIGAYGRHSTPARCIGIGRFFYGDVVAVPKHMVDSLSEDDWRKAEDLCQYERMDGKICGSNKLVPGSVFCEVHHREVFGELPDELKKKDAKKAKRKKES